MLLKKIYDDYSFGGYVILGVVWAIIAMMLDYFFMVKMINPPDGYYKFDVYVYYVLTLLLPAVVGYIKTRPTA